MYQLETNNHVDTLTGWTPAWQTNGATNKYKFYVGSYTTTKPLIIEIDCGENVAPTTAIKNLLYSTYWGGTSYDEFTDVAIGSTGNIYFTGYSTSTSFPLTTGTNITGNAGNEDAIVLKLDNNNVPVWGTFLG
jgi:hypothetical protein